MNKILDRQTTFQDYLRVLVKRRWLMLAIFLGVTAIGAFISLRMPSVYRAIVTIRVEQKPNLISPATYYYMWDPNFFDTEIALMKSRSLSARVINYLKTAYQTDPPEWKEKYLSNFALDISVIPGVYHLQFENEEGDYAISNASGAIVGNGRNQESFSNLGMRFILDYPNPQKEVSCSITIGNFNGMVENLRTRILAQPIKNVNMIELQFFGSNPIEVASLANVIAEQYILESQVAKTQQATATRKFIEDQLKLVETKLVNLEEAIKDYKEKEKVVDVSAKADLLINNIAEFEKLKASSEIDLYTVNSEYNRIQSTLQENGDSLDSYENVYSSPYLFNTTKDVNFYENLQILYNERKKLLEYYTEEHPRIKELDAEIAATEKAFKDSIEQSLTYGDLGTKRRQLTNYIDLMNQKIADLDQELSKMPEKQLILLRLQREAKANEDIYNMLLSKYQEAQIAESMKDTNLAVVDYATPPTGPISPNHFTNIGLAAVLGLVLGIVAILVLEILDNTINTAEELERFTGLPIVGLIPKAKHSSIPKPGTVNQNRPVDRYKYLVSHLEPKSPEAEAYRSLRTNLAAVKVDGILQTMVITSSILSEGKSSVATNLSIIFAIAGRKTILVDADLRRSLLHHVFQMNRSPGLTEVCVEKMPVTKVIRATEIPNLFVLTSGFRPPNPAEILDSKTMDKLIADLRKNFEIVIFDTPPALAVTDPIILAKKVDACFVVILANSTTYHSIRMTQQFLANAGVTPNGAILNGIDFAKSYGPYGYKYYHYYSEEDKKK